MQFTSPLWYEEAASNSCSSCRWRATQGMCARFFRLQTHCKETEGSQCHWAPLLHLVQLGHWQLWIHPCLFHHHPTYPLTPHCWMGQVRYTETSFSPYPSMPLCWWGRCCPTYPTIILVLKDAYPLLQLEPVFEPSINSTGLHVRRFLEPVVRVRLWPLREMLRQILSDVCPWNAAIELVVPFSNLVNKQWWTTLQGFHMPCCSDILSQYCLLTIQTEVTNSFWQLGALLLIEIQLLQAVYVFSSLSMTEWYE